MTFLIWAAVGLWVISMNFKSLKREELDEKKLPDSIYKSVVSSLYADPNSLFIGIACCVAGALVLFLKTMDPAQLIFAGIFFFVGTVRLLLAHSFKNAAAHELSIKTFQKWENKYTFISTVYIAILGFWYANGLVRSDDPFVQLLSLSLILCYLIGVIGRNFASNKVVRAQVTTSIVMLIGTAIFFDDIYGLVLTFFLIPFLIAIHLMSTRLRRMLFKAEINALNNSVMANRFDVALENVTHGIAMIDKAGVVVVANERFMELAGMRDWEIIGCNISILETVNIEGNKYHTLGQQIQSCLLESESADFTFNLASGAIIEAEYNSMIDGGVVMLSDVSERKASEKVITDLANFDGLTNLYNRRYFVEGVEAYLKSKQNAASSMYFIDLDKFKAINDTLGHAIGDELLRVISARLKLMLNDNSMLCRFGGDEFILFYPGLNEADQCAQLANKILQELHQPVIIQNHEIEISGSIGIALSPAHGTTANMLLQHADAALYDAKAQGRSTFTFYTSALGEAISQKRQLETDLRNAMKNDEIDLFYQPIFDIKNCRIAGCEALARWSHPEHGNVSPGVFIELAEETGLIVKLGEQLLRKAMLECLKWPDEMQVAVNVSSIQFQKTDMYKTVLKLLNETGLPSSKLTIEVTESAMIDSISDITDTLNQLSNIGVTISLDDFGTGFSSLSYLHTMPFDKVKIDKSFVDNGVASARSLVLLQGVVDLIKRLGLKVVLEGIETNEQLDVMEKSIDVNEYQGYLFFKPMSATDFYDLAYKSTNTSSQANITRLARMN